MTDVTCVHVWETQREPVFQIVCTKCGKVFDAKDSECMSSLSATWVASLNAGLPISKFLS